MQFFRQSRFQLAIMDLVKANYVPGNDKRQFQRYPYFGNEKRQLHIRSTYQTKQTVDWQLFQGLYRSRDTIRDKNPILTLRPHLFELRDARRASFNTFSIVPQLFPVYNLRIVITRRFFDRHRKFVFVFAAKISTDASSSSISKSLFARD